MRFSEFVTLVEAFGFKHDRTTGSHHIFMRSDVPDIVNIQPRGDKVKAYQVREFLSIVERHALTLEDA